MKKPMQNYSFPELSYFLSYRMSSLRWLRSGLMRFGIGDVKFTGNEDDFLRSAHKHIPFLSRWFGKRVDLTDLERRYGPNSERQNRSWDRTWQEFRAEVREGDSIYPFAINFDTLAMRLGFVVVRSGRPVKCLVVVSS